MHNFAKNLLYAVGTVALVLFLLLALEEVQAIFHAANRLPGDPSMFNNVYMFGRDEFGIFILAAVIAFLPIPWSKKRLWYCFGIGVALLWSYFGWIFLQILNTCEGEGCNGIILAPLFGLASIFLIPVLFGVGYLLHRFYSRAMKPLLILGGVCVLFFIASIGTNHFCLRGDGSCLGQYIAQANEDPALCAATADFEACYYAYSQTKYDPRACDSMWEEMQNRCATANENSIPPHSCDESNRWDCLNNFGKTWNDLSVCRQFPRGPGTYTDTNCCRYVTGLYNHKRFDYIFTAEERIACGLEP